LVPPIPYKKMGFRRFDPDYVDKRMKLFQKFMNEIMNSEYFKSSEALIAFLSFKDRSMFENKMKELNTYQSPGYVEDMRTLDGKVTLVDKEDNEKYFTNICKYFHLQTQLFDRINLSLKSFIDNIEKASLDLKDIHRDFKTLYNINKRVSMVNYFI
jgi:hypothetical protein